MNDRTDHAAEAARVVASIQRETEAAKSIEDPSQAGVALFNTNVRRELAYAQVHATLALAEQQRLANLITLVNTQIIDSSALLDGPFETGETYRLKPAIATALRIGDPA